MKKKNVFSKIIVISFLIGLNTIFLVEFAAAQCGNYFKTSYRKTVPFGGPLDVGYQVADWTGDGKADFWKTETNTATSTKNILIYPNNGSGAFNWDNPTIITTPIPSSSNYILNLFDYNLDGKNDIYIYPTGGSLTIYQNSGSNSLIALATNNFFDDADNPHFQTIGFIDVNSDNIPDLIRVNGVPNQGNSINYRLGNAAGVFGAKVDILISPLIINQLKATGDFTGDGKQDIIYSTGGNLLVLISNGNGTFTNGPVTPNVHDGNKIFKDFDNDGKTDVINVYNDDISTNPPRHFFFYKSNGNGTFVGKEFSVFQVNSIEYGANSTIPVSADFNGDNFPDVIELGQTFYSIHLNNGSGSFTRADYQKFLGSSQDLIFNNFNSDNKADIYVRSNFTTIFNENILLLRYNQCQPAGQTKLADFNNSLNANMVIWNPNTGIWSSMSGDWSGGGFNVKRYNWGAGSLGDIPSPGDYDGDGKTDYAVFRNSTGDWFINQSSDSGFFGMRFGTTGDIPVPADYNGGGKTDIAVYRPSVGSWYIWFTETQQFYAVRFGAPGDKPVAQDYDGDQKADVAVFRPSEGNWYYLKSSDQGFVGINWGLGTDIPIPADYDGDGKSDIAVYRGGDWYILRSSNNSFNYLRWGTSGDVPFGFYKNGESAIPVVYRASNFVWYLYFNTPSAITFGSSQDVPIYFGLPNN